MKPCTPANKVEFYGKTRFFRLLVLFLIISPKFINWFCSFGLHCVQDIPTNKSLFFKTQKSCVSTILWRKTSKKIIWYNLQSAPPIFTFEVEKCSKRSLNQRLICVVLPLFGFAKLEAIVCITTRKMCDFRQVSKRFPNSKQGILPGVKPRFAPNI